jgi:hypothetical protein
MGTTWRDSRFGPGSYEFSAQEDRCAPRIKVSIPSSLRPSGGKGFHTVVSELSQAGFSASSLNRMHPGTICWLTLPGLESLQSEVVWWTSGQVGCAFAALLSPIVLDNYAARYPGNVSVDRVDPT